MSDNTFCEADEEIGTRFFEGDGDIERGWYWYDEGYSDEGLAGPFESRAAAIKNAREVHENAR